MMLKPAENEYEIEELIAKRWSPRAFSTQAIEPEKVRSLLEAARWAASCFNEQPWSFIVAPKTDAEEFERLLDCLVESNRRWAQHAPLLMLSVARLNFERNNKPNRHAFHDVGQAVASLTLQATALGLVVHQMAGFEIEKARREYDLPEGFEPVAAIAVGYQGDASKLPEDLRERELAPRTRRAQESFVFKGKWGKPWRQE